MSLPPATYLQLGREIDQLRHRLDRVATRLAAARSCASKPAVFRARQHTLPLGGRTYVVGIVNVTPDSFSGDGLVGDPDAAVDYALHLEADGADLLDVGGESTRPGAAPVTEAEELRRVIPVIERLASRARVPISVDTRHAVVARAALEAGAHIVNDITGFQGEAELAAVAAEFDAGVILMHMRGTPATMQIDPHYDDVLGEVTAFLERGIEVATAAGIDRDRIVVDPGIGFGKTLQHNLEILRRLRDLEVLGQPVLVGTSRKSFIGRLTGRDVRDRVFGTAASVALAVANGADLVRVHDVAAIVDVVRVADAIVRARVDQ